MNRVEHRPDVIVRRNFRHAEQSMAIGGLASFFERALVGQERLRLHEKQRKRRQADVGHRIRAVVALPLVGKGTAGRSQSIRRFNSEVQQRCIDDMAEHRGWGKGGGKGASRRRRCERSEHP